MQDGSALPQERTLTVTSYAEVKGKYEKKRVTINPGMIHFIIASEETYETVEGRDLRQVNVLLTEGGNLELFISEVDLMTLERVTGAYFI